MKLTYAAIPLLLLVAVCAQASEPEEGLTKPEVDHVVKAHRGEIRKCFESTKVGPDLSQVRVVADFTISVDGSVVRARVESSTAANSRLGECILSKLNSWKFPKPASLVEVDVSYPFIFEALK